MPPDFESQPPLPDVRVLGTYNWDWLEGHLQGVPILGDKRKNPNDSSKWRRPYANAKIELKTVPLSQLIGEARPLALYYLRQKVPLFRAVIGQLSYEDGIDVLKLNKDITALLVENRSIMMAGEKSDDGRRLIIPPILEYSLRDKRPVIVDGLHRLLYVVELAGKKTKSYWKLSPWRIARRSGIEVSAVYISNVNNGEEPGHMPLVPLPVAWERLLPYDFVPPEHEKRIFAWDNTKHRELYGDGVRYNFRDFGLSGGERQISAQTKTGAGLPP